MISESTRIRLLKWSGVLLLFLGIVHLVATPHIATFIRLTARPGAADMLIPPMLLNHILVGLLLFPLGFLTIYAAPHSAPWARMIVRATALTVATLPLTLLALMGLRYFEAPLFVVGFLIVVAASVTLLLAAFAKPRPADMS